MGTTGVKHEKCWHASSITLSGDSTMTMTGIFVANDPLALQSFNDWLGTDADIVGAHTGRANWTDWQTSISWEASLWKGSGANIEWTIPMFANGGNLASAAAGAYNNYYLTAAQTLLDVSSGTGKIIVRVGEEFNGSWMPWAAAGQEQNYINAYHDFVDVFRSVSDRFEFVWCTSVGSNGMNPEAAYPGDQYVDIIATDFYYNQWQSSDPATAWNNMVKQPYGLQWLEDFAAAHGKPTAYSEWGVQYDNAGAFIDSAAKWFAAHKPLYQIYWDSNIDSSLPTELSQHPATAAAYLKDFGTTISTITSFSPDTNVIGDGITNTNHITLTGAAVAGSTVLVFDGTTQIGTAVADANGVWSFATATLSDGNHAFTSKTVDLAGNISAASAALNVTVDTVAPGAPVIASFSPDSSIAGDGITNANHITLTGTGEAGSVVQIFDGMTLLGTATANASGAWSFATATLSDGTHAFAGKAIDAAGNISATSAAVNVTVDTVAPMAPKMLSFSPDTDIVGDGVTSANVLTLTGTVEAGCSVEIFDGATKIGTVVATDVRFSTLSESVKLVELTTVSVPPFTSSTTFVALLFTR